MSYHAIRRFWEFDGVIAAAVAVTLKKSSGKSPEFVTVVSDSGTFTL